MYLLLPYDPRHVLGLNKIRCELVRIIFGGGSKKSVWSDEICFWFFDHSGSGKNKMPDCVEGKSEGVLILFLISSFIFFLFRTHRGSLA